MYVAHCADGWSKHHVYIGRPTVNRKGSALQNPFRLRSTTTVDIAANLRQYRRWLYTRMMAGDAAVWQALRDLRPQSVLVDYIQPRASHGHVVRNAWLWAVQQGWIDPQPLATDQSERQRHQTGEVKKPGPARYDVRQPQTPAAPVTVPVAKARKSRKAAKVQLGRDVSAAASLLALLGADPALAV